MPPGLMGLWNLSTPQEVEPDKAEIVAKLREEFTDATATVRDVRRELATIASEEEAQAIANKLDKLEQAYGLISSKIDPADPAKAHKELARVITAVKSVEADARVKLKRAEQERAIWTDAEPALEEAMARLDELSGEGVDTGKLYRAVIDIQSKSQGRAYVSAAKDVDDLRHAIRDLEQDRASKGDRSDDEDAVAADTPAFEFEEGKLSDGFKEQFKADEISQHFKDATDKIGSPDDITDPFEGVAELVETTGEATKNAGAGLREFGDGIGEQTEEKLRGKGEVIEAFGAVTGELGEMAAEVTGEVAGGALEGAGKVIEGAGDAADKAFEGVDHMLDGEYGEGVGKMFDGAKGLIGGTAEGAVDVAGGMIKGGAEVAEGLAATGAEFVEGGLEIFGVTDDNDDDGKSFRDWYQEELKERLAAEGPGAPGGATTEEAPGGPGTSKQCKVPRDHGAAAPFFEDDSKPQETPAKPFTLAVQVIGPDKKPVKDAQVMTDVGPKGLTKANGVTKIEMLPAQQLIVVTVVADLGGGKIGRSTRMVTGRPTTTEVLTVSLKPEKTAVDEFVEDLQNTYDLNVTVLDGNGQTLSNAKVWHGNTKAVTTGPNGWAALVGLPAGELSTITVEFKPIGEGKKERVTTMVKGQKNTCEQTTIQMKSTSDVIVRPSDPKFWDSLQGVAVDGLGLWLTGSFLNAVGQFNDEMTKDETPTDEVAWGAVKSALGKIPGGEEVGKVGDIALWVAGKLHQKQNLEDFVDNARGAVETASQRIAQRKGDPFDTIKRLAAGDQKDDEKFRLKVERSLRKAITQMPSRQNILAAMATAWTAGAKDGLDLDMSGGKKSGYIMVEAMCDARRKRMGLTKPPYLDDVTLPDNTRDVMKRGYGANTPLEDLPIQMNLRIHYIMTPKDDDRDKSKKMVYNFMKGEKGSFRFVSKYASGWTFSETVAAMLFDSPAPEPAEILKLWTSSGAKPTISDLRDESLLWKYLSSKVVE